MPQGTRCTHVAASSHVSRAHSCRSGGVNNTGLGMVGIAGTTIQGCVPSMPREFNRQCFPSRVCQESGSQFYCQSSVCSLYGKGAHCRLRRVCKASSHVPNCTKLAREHRRCSKSTQHVLWCAVQSQRLLKFLTTPPCALPVGDLCLAQGTASSPHQAQSRVVHKYVRDH